jgi:hypothetical protein
VIVSAPNPDVLVPPAYARTPLLVMQYLKVLVDSVPDTHCADSPAYVAVENDAEKFGSFCAIPDFRAFRPDSAVCPVTKLRVSANGSVVPTETHVGVPEADEHEYVSVPVSITFIPATSNNDFGGICA